MILLVDIGNTNIVTGCAEEGKILFCERLSTNHRATTLEYMTVFRTAFELYNIDKEKIDGAVISSVVPSVTNVIRLLRHTYMCLTQQPSVFTVLYSF